MRRDMDLIRELVLKLEALPVPAGGVCHVHGADKALSVDGHTPDEIEYHLSLIEQSGLLNISDARPTYGVVFRGLTPAGHDFADAVRDPMIWKKTKDGALAAGGWTLELLGDLAKGFLKQQAKKITGLDL